MGKEKLTPFVFRNRQPRLAIVKLTVDEPLSFDTNVKKKDFEDKDLATNESITVDLDDKIDGIRLQWKLKKDMGRDKKWERTYDLAIPKKTLDQTGPAVVELYEDFMIWKMSAIARETDDKSKARRRIEEILDIDGQRKRSRN